MRIRRFMGCGLPVLLAGVGAWTAPALAAGGSNIRSAPMIAYGQQEFGNTATDSTEAQDFCGRQSWWMLPVVSGDRVTIDFEGPGLGYAITYPIGTTDFNVAHTGWFHETQIGDNGAGESVFNASSSGVMPVDFVTDDCDFDDSYDPGPYDFTAYVAHGVVLSIPHVRSLKHKGTLSVGAHTPDGGAISDPALVVQVQMKRHSHWTTIGAAPVANSLATVHLAIPKRVHSKRISLRSRSTGPGYLTRTSAARRVRLRAH
jgi:hypothetical protein